MKNKILNFIKEFPAYYLMGFSSLGIFAFIKEKLYVGMLILPCIGYIYTLIIIFVISYKYLYNKKTNN